MCVCVCVCVCVCHSGNYYYSALRLASIDEVKIQKSKSYHDSIKPHVQTTSLFERIKKGRVLLRLELWPKCCKISLRNQTQTKIT